LETGRVTHLKNKEEQTNDFEEMRKRVLIIAQDRNCEPCLDNSAKKRQITV